MKHNSGQSLYLATNSAQASFSLSAGRKTSSSFTSTLKLIHLGEYSGIDLTFLGTGANNDTIDYKVWCAMLLATETPKDAPSIAELQQFGSGTITLASGIAGDGSVFSSSTYFGDTLTFTPSTWGAYVVDAYQLDDPTAFSPADNATVAHLTIPLMARVCGAVLIEFDLTGTSTGANAMYSLTA